MSGRTRIVLVGVVAATLLAACTPAPPVTGPAPMMERQASLVDTQAQGIVLQTFDAIARADASQDITLAGDRISGDAATVRAAQYTVAATDSARQPDQLPTEQQAIYVSSSSTWPRVMAAVSVEPTDSTAPVVTLWVQDTVNSPYSLRGWAHMIPGAALPAMPTDAIGAAELSLDSDLTSPTPGEALATYLDYLRQGPSGELAASFEPDRYAELLFTARDTLTSAAAAAAGNYVDTIDPDLAHSYVLETADGGALVFAAVSVASAFSVSAPGATVSLQDADVALVSGSLTTSVVHRYRDFVVIHVPPVGSGVKPMVVAADHHLVTVTPD